MVGEHLGHNEDFVPTPGNCLAHQFLGRPRSIELCGIDVSHPEIEPAAECSCRDGGLSLLDEPGALADHRNLATARPELPFLHERSPYRPGARAEHTLFPRSRRIRGLCMIARLADAHGQGPGRRRLRVPSRRTADEVLAALVVYLAYGSDDEVRLIKGEVFGALVGEQLLRVRGQLEPRRLRARDAVLILLLFRRQLSRRIEGVDTMVARREYAYRA